MVTHHHGSILCVAIYCYRKVRDGAQQILVVPALREIVVVVEGEDDAQSLEALIRAHDVVLCEMLDVGTIAFDSLGGGTNLTYKLGLYRDALCMSHVFLDDDDCGRKSFEAARQAGLLTEANVNFAKVRGQNETEFEDLLRTDFYEEAFLNHYRISVQHPAFKSKSREKWSVRMRAIFEQTGKPWNDRIKGEIKAKVSELVRADPSNALEANRRHSFDGLVNNLKLRLEEISNGCN